MIEKFYETINKLKKKLFLSQVVIISLFIG